MRPALPDKLGSEFWLSLFFVVLCLSGLLLGLARGWGYQTAVAGLFSFVAVYWLVQHIRAVRLGKKLKLDPEMSKIYYGREI